MNFAPVTISVAAVTDRGSVRERNEDAVLVGGFIAQAEHMDVGRQTYTVTTPFAVAVADGLGGHRGGREASRTALDRFVSGTVDLLTPADVGPLLEDVNRSLFDQMAGHPELAGMGTTICGCVVLDSRVVAFNVGDSSVMRWSSISGVEPMTVPDRRPGASAGLLQCLGGATRPTVIDPQWVSVAIDDAIWLVCSDGVTDVVNADEIDAVLRRASGSLVEAVAHLLNACKDRGAPDNVSVAALSIEVASP
jgi:serine/threonine protein phosphatase PrpC